MYLTKVKRDVKSGNISLSYSRPARNGESVNDFTETWREQPDKTFYEALDALVPFALSAANIMMPTIELNSIWLTELAIDSTNEDIVSIKLELPIGIDDARGEIKLTKLDIAHSIIHGKYGNEFYDAVEAVRVEVEAFQKGKRLQKSMFDLVDDTGISDVSVSADGKATFHVKDSVS